MKNENTLITKTLEITNGQSGANNWQTVADYVAWTLE